MPIACFSRTIDGYRQIENEIRSNLGIEISSHDISRVVYEYAAKKGLEDSADAFNQENIQECREYVFNHFLIDKYIDLGDDASNNEYIDWYLNNVDDNGVIDITDATQEEIDNNSTIAMNADKVVSVGNKKYQIVPRAKGFVNRSVYYEMQQIRKDAVANEQIVLNEDGSFDHALAPNGKRSNLNERQWLQVRTKAFKKWFGDWENDPQNASKVVDENGEPLVVYHHTKNKFTTFSYEKAKNDGFYFTSSKNANHIYYPNGMLGSYITMPVFLNINSGFIYNGKDFIRDSSVNIEEALLRRSELESEISALVSKEQFTEADEKLLDKKVVEQEQIEQRINDGEAYPANLFDMFTADRRNKYRLPSNGIIKVTDNESFYVVYDANQIKSAEGNTGEFSDVEDNIYHNRQPISLEQRLNDANLIHKFDNKYWISVKGEEGGIENRKKEILEYLERNGYPEDSITFRNTKNGSIVSINYTPDKEDAIKREVDKSFKSINAVMSFLSEKIPSIKDKIHRVSVTEAKRIIKQVAGRELLPNETSFVLNNNIYLINTRASKDAAIEEALHVLTESLIGENRTLADSLLSEAKKLFPLLEEEIHREYKKIDWNAELLTQALTRVFRKEFDATAPEQRQTAESILSRFVEWVRKLFGLRTNPVTGNKMIDLEELPQAMTLQDLADLINSNDGEFLTFQHRGLQFNKQANNFTNKGTFEVSTAAGKNGVVGDSRFSAHNAKFKQGTIIFGHDVGGRTIESVYQHGIKQGDWTTDNNRKTGAPKDKTIITGKTENDSYIQGYLPLWQEWARQNPQLIEELRIKSEGMTLTDVYAKTEVSQARALTEILNAQQPIKNRFKQSTPKRSASKPSEYNPSPSVKKAAKTFEEQVNDVKQSLKRLGSKIRRDSHFDSNHKYQILGTDGKWHTADTSVTGIKESFKGEDKSYVDVGKIGKKTKTKNITIDKDLIKNQSDWRKENPDGIVAFRVNTKTYNTEKAVSDGIIGNPFKVPKYSVPVATQMFMNWLLTGENYGELEANEEFRGAIIDKILSSPEGTKILYYKELGEPSHATVIDYLINHKDLFTSQNTPATAIGTSFDKMVRDFFDGGILAPDYKNIPLNKQKEIREELVSLKDFFDKKFKDGYQIITDEDLLKIGGQVMLNGQVRSVAGTMDMLLLAKNGNDYDIYIFDVKTSRAEQLSDEALVKYTDQIAFYRALLSDSVPELASKIKGTGIILANTYYGDGNSNKYTDYSVSESGNILYLGSAINPRSNDAISIHLHGRIEVGNSISMIDTSTVLDDQNFSVEGVDIEELESMSGLGDSAEDAKDAAKVIKKKNKETKIAKTGSYEILSNVSIQNNKDVLSEREKTMLGRSLVKYISWTADKLAAGDIELKKNIFGDYNKKDKNKKRESSYKNDFFVGKRNTMMTSSVFTAIKNYVIESYDFFDTYNLKKSDPMYMKINYATKNVDALINRAFSELVKLENISITTSGEIVNSEIGEDILEMYEAAEQASEERAAYSIDARTVSYLGSISQEMKRKFSRIIDYKYDENGNILKDEDGRYMYAEDEWGWNIPQFISHAKVINKIFEICHGYGDINQMMNALDVEKTNIPWLQQVIDIINGDKKIKNQFFTVFRKNHTNYMKTYKEEFFEKGEDGKWKKLTRWISLPLSDNNSTNKILSGVSIQLNANNIDFLGHTKGSAAGIYVVKKNELDKFKEIISMAKDILSSKNSTRMDKIDAIDIVINYLGINDVSDLSIISGADAGNILSNVITKATNILNIVDSKDRVSFLVDLNGEYYSLASILSPFFGLDSERSQFDNGKSRMTYTEPTQIQTIVDRLAGRETVPYLGDGVLSKDELYELLFSEKYDKYWQFGYMDESIGKKVYRNYWLEELHDNPEIRKYFNHYVKTSSLDTEYQEQSDGVYGPGIFLDYLSASMKVKGKERFYTGKNNIGIYRIPTMSDKNADERIQFLKISGKNMKEKISNHAFEYLLFELTRMKDLIEAVNDEDVIENYSIPKTERWIKIADSKSKTKVTLKDILSIQDSSGMRFDYLPMFNEEFKNNSDYAKIMLRYLNGDIAAKGELRDGFSEIFQKGLNGEVEKIKKQFKDSDIYDIIIASVDNINSESHVDKYIEEFVYNDFLAACNIFNLTVIDPAFHKNSSDLQKRFAEFHSSTQKPNLLAETDGGKRVTDGKMRYIVLDDILKDSNIISDIQEVFNDAIESAPTEQRQKELRKLSNDVVRMFSNINITDGQALATPTAFWKKLKLLGLDTPELAQAIERIKSGDFHVKDFGLCIQAFKPFVFSQREQIVANRPTLIPTQIKDSEAMLFLANSIVASKASGKSMISTLYDIAESSHYDSDGNYRNDGIDVIVFKSAVKTGASMSININGLTPEEAGKKIRKNIYDKDGKYTKRVQSINFEDWGKQQEVPNHLKDMQQAMPSQGRVLCIADLENSKTYHIAGQTEPVSRDDFIKRYYHLHDRLIEIGANKAMEKLGIGINYEGTEEERNKKLSEILLNSIKNDSKYSIQLNQAFTLVNGKFTMPIGDPSFGDKAYGSILSFLKKTINDEMYNGGPVVIRSGFGGTDSNLSFFKDKDGGWTAEVACTFTTSEIEENCTFNSERHEEIAKKYRWGNKYKDGDIIDVDDAVKTGLVNWEDIIGIADRIPTEGKYSQIRYRIKKFLPSFMGEYMIFPNDKTKIGGDDFDIDKVFIRRKRKINREAYAKKVASGEIEPDISFEDYLDEIEIKNEIFDMQWQALGHKSSHSQMYTPSSFDPLKDLAKKMNPDFGHKEHPLVYMSSQIFYHNANSAGKRYVGIAALNNTAHALASTINCGFTKMISFSINGINSSMMKDKNGEYRFDDNYSAFDGSLISDSIRMFVGASADNAKEAVLGSLNVTPVTANMFMGMLRMGIPLDVAIYIINIPRIKELSKKCEEDGSRFEDAILSEFTQDKFNEEYTSIDITSSELLKRINGKVPVDDDFDRAVCSLLRDLIPYCQAIRYATDRCALNSAKNAAHKNGYDALIRKLKADEYASSNTDEAHILNSRARNILNEIPFLGRLSWINTELIPEIFETFSPLFKDDFTNYAQTGVIDMFVKAGIRPSDMDEAFVRKVLNAWLVYKSSALGVIGASPENRKDIIYNFPANFMANQPALQDNSFISNSSVRKMNGRYNIASVKFDSTRMTTEQKDDVAESYGELKNYGDAKVSKFADDIMEYMIMRYGFTFSPESSMPIAPNIAKIKYRRKDGVSPYNQLFEHSFKPNETVYHAVNFLYQYARNNPKSKLWFRYDDVISNKTYSSSTKKLLVPSEISNMISSVSSVGITARKKLFVPTEEETMKDGIVYSIYKEVERLGIDNQFLEYNANEGAFNMASVITTKNNVEQKNTIFALTDELNDDVVDENESDANGNVEDGAPSTITIFDKIAKNKSLIKELGLPKEFLDTSSEEGILLSKLQEIYNLASDAGITNKHASIMKEIKKILCE